MFPDRPCPRTYEQKYQLQFTYEELKEYYSTIRNDSSVSDSFKLKIADALIDMRG